MRLRGFILAVSVAVALLPAVAASPSWEEHRTASVQQDGSSKERTDSETIEITTRDGYVYISTPQPVNVKIFSILGQLVSQENIPAGSYRLRLANRGIYILKAGSITRRITI